jgi:hypothetical protein
MQKVSSQVWSWLSSWTYNPKPPTAGDDDDRGDDPEAVSASLPPPPPTQARQARDKPSREDLVGVAARCCCYSSAVPWCAALS